MKVIKTIQGEHLRMDRGYIGSVLHRRFENHRTGQVEWQRMIQVSQEQIASIMTVEWENCPTPAGEEEAVQQGG